MSTKTYVVRISEDKHEPEPGTATMDIMIHHKNYPTDKKITEILNEHFGDWYVTVVPT